MVGSEEQGLSQAGIAGLGRPVVVVVDAGLVDLGDQSGEGADAGEAVEPVQVAGAAQDPCCGDDAGR